MLKQKETFFQMLAKYPYLFAFLACIGLNPFFFGSVGNIPNNMLWICTLLTAGIFAFFLYKRHDRLSVIFTVTAGIFWITGLMLYSQSEHPAFWHFAGGSILLTAVYHFFIRDQKFKRQKTALLIMGLGFFLKLYYVLETSVYTRQHDVEDFNVWEGHSGYMTYLIENHHLCDTDVTEHWQFAHPPLHHILGALWIELNDKLFHTGIDPARESLQMLTLFYSMCIMILSYKIFRYFKLDGKPLYIALCIVNFHPAFILFSGSVNNDVLSVVFMTGTVLTVLNWYQKPDLINIAKIALCIGLGMMTKLSSALVAPPTAFVFLTVFLKNFKKDGKNIFRQFLYFAGICVPLGLWYPVRSWLKWDIPILYVHEVSLDDAQYVGGKSFSERISDFSFYQFKSPYEQWAGENPDSYNESNPLIALLKTSLFGEGISENLFEHSQAMNEIAVIFFWLNVIIAGTALISMLVTVFRKNSIQPEEKIFFLSFYLFMLGNFYSMSAKYPLVCTMNFRYLTPTVITGALFSALMLKNQKKPAVLAMQGLTLGFVLCSEIIYLAVGYYPGE